VSTIERQYFRVASVVLFATMLLSLFLEHVVASTWHAARARDFGWFWAAALLLVFGIRALRRSGKTRSAIATTAAGALMFLAFAGAGVLADHVLRGSVEALQPTAPRRESDEETKRAIEQIETIRPAARQAAMS
jgi:hypothetical protein